MQDSVGRSVEASRHQGTEAWEAEWAGGSDGQEASEPGKRRICVRENPHYVDDVGSTNIGELEHKLHQRGAGPPAIAGKFNDHTDPIQPIPNHAALREWEHQETYRSSQTSVQLAGRYTGRSSQAYGDGANDAHRLNTRTVPNEDYANVMSASQATGPHRVHTTPTTRQIASQGASRGIK